MTDQVLLDKMRELIAERRLDGIEGIAHRIGPAEWADLIPNLDADELSDLLDTLPQEEVSELLAELSPESAARILKALPAHEASGILGEMEPDDATDVLAEFSAPLAESLLSRMDHEEAADIRELMAFPPDTAGGIMTPAFLAVAPDLRLDQTVVALRSIGEEAEGLYYVYVVDPDERLVGVVPFHKLVLGRPDQLISEIMAREPIRVRADTDAELAARLLRDRNLLALPVVDDEEHLLGIVTVDDAADLIEDALEEDYLRLAGSSDAELMERRNALEIARLRVPWLLGTMVIELFAGVVISRFDHVLTEVILLASFMPVISAISGNVGLQAAAIVVRGLDTGHVQADKWKRQLVKELETSLLMAVACGLVLGTVGAIWSRHIPFGLVIGGALTASMLTASFMGTMFPIASKRLGFDPAATAGPFETAFQDVIGFGVFLWLASLLVDYLH